MAAFNCIKKKKKKKEENKWQMRAHFPHPPVHCNRFPGEGSSQGFLLRDAFFSCSLPASISCAEPLPLHASRSWRQCHARKCRGIGPAPLRGGETLTACGQFL